MQPIMFSIVVPIYGVEAYLHQCIESVLEQTCKSFELILVDDGSKDNCPKICDEYAIKDNRIKVIHKENGGLVSARQAGVSIACGEYIVCIDGDDWIGKNYLSDFEYVINSSNPDVIVCGHINACSGHETIKKPRYRIGFYDRDQMESLIFPCLVEAEDGHYFPPSLWAKAFKKNIYQQQQLVDCKINIGEDVACTIPTIYHSQSLYISDKYEYYYRINPSSITRNKKAFDPFGQAKVHNHIAERLDLRLFDFKNQLNRKTAHVLFSILVSQFYKPQSYFKTRKEILCILNTQPFKECIENCHFKRSFKSKLMEVALKNRIIVLIYLFSKMK